MNNLASEVDIEARAGTRSAAGPAGEARCGLNLCPFKDNEAEALGGVAAAAGSDEA